MFARVALFIRRYEASAIISKAFAIQNLDGKVNINLAVDIVKDAIRDNPQLFSMSKIGYRPSAIALAAFSLSWAISESASVNQRQSARAVVMDFICWQALAQVLIEFDKNHNGPGQATPEDIRVTDAARERLLNYVSK